MLNPFEDRFASPQQCVHASFWVVSILTLGTTILAIIYYLEAPRVLDPSFNDNCRATEGEDAKVCDVFAVLAFFGSVCFLLFWLPLMAASVVFHYYPALTNADVSSIAADYRTATARANLSLAVLAIVLLALTSFCFGITLIVKMHREWAFWAYAYMAIIIGGSAGLLLIMSLSFYFGSVLVMQVLICSGTPEEEIRRKYLFGAGTQRALSLESDSNMPELAHDATPAELRHERRRLRDMRHQMNSFSRELHAREALVEKREHELERVERKLAKRKHDLEEGEKAISTRELAAVIT